MRFWTTTLLISAFIFFFIHTVVLANDEKCPAIDSPEATAIKFKLFAAYQTGFDGYAIPCELKCMQKEGCTKKCQTKEALRFLNEKMQELTQGENQIQCPMHTIGCIEQCESEGIPCLAACGREKPIAGQ